MSLALLRLLAVLVVLRLATDILLDALGDAEIGYYVRSDYLARRDINTSRSNKCTSCSFFSNAPWSGGITLC